MLVLFRPRCWDVVVVDGDEGRQETIYCEDEGSTKTDAKTRSLPKPKHHQHQHQHLLCYHHIYTHCDARHSTLQDHDYPLTMRQTLIRRAGYVPPTPHPAPEAYREDGPTNCKLQYAPVSWNVPQEQCSSVAAPSSGSRWCEAMEQGESVSWQVDERCQEEAQSGIGTDMKRGTAAKMGSAGRQARRIECMPESRRQHGQKC